MKSGNTWKHKIWEDLVNQNFHALAQQSIKTLVGIDTILEISHDRSHESRRCSSEEFTSLIIVCILNFEPSNKDYDKKLLIF